jgi:hypothetical protein
MKQKNKKQEESGRDGDALSGVNAQTSAQSLISGGRSGDEKNHRCRVLAQCKWNATKSNARLCLSSSPTQSMTRYGAKELVALSIVSAKQDQSSQRREQVKTVDGEKLLVRVQLYQEQ